MPVLDSLYSAKESAEKLGVNPSRVRQICGGSAGRIGKKLGRDWFLSEAELELIRLTILRNPEKSSE